MRSVRLSDGLFPVIGTSFRSFYRRYVFLNYRPAVGDCGIVAYGVIDPKAGISFVPAAYVRIEGTHLKMRRAMEDDPVLRLTHVLDRKWRETADFHLDTPYFDLFSRLADDRYDSEDPQLENTRSCTWLDPVRNESFPDDLRVQLWNDMLAPAAVWVQARLVSGQQAYGTLLEEPCFDFGVHQGQMIDLHMVRLADGSRICVHKSDAGNYRASFAMRTVSCL
ncbi:MAG: hypothetical protein MR707_04280 [Galactobacillus timonensis]|uniref:hypothetical protein n=1 Tax=Galactobacillus timonensis TaxID=2041840 RepID=UPI0023F1F49F|nr:hypothetical protein [Galactobacillus timonensis]MCI6067431.1 hypothetical protein [Galactobacillus timonensis]